MRSEEANPYQSISINESKSMRGISPGRGRVASSVGGAVGFLLGGAGGKLTMVLAGEDQSVLLPACGISALFALSAFNAYAVQKPRNLLRSIIAVALIGTGSALASQPIAQALGYRAWRGRREPEQHPERLHALVLILAATGTLAWTRLQAVQRRQISREDNT